MSVILGLASSHDASACVLVDGALAAAVSLERITRRKNDGARLPLEALEHALEAAGVTRAQVDGVAAIHSFFPERYFRRESLAKELEARLVRLRRERLLNVNDQLKRLTARGEGIGDYFRREEFLAALGLRAGIPVRFYDHHATHAMAAAWYSGFADCAVLTIDGVGELNIHHTASTWSAGRLQRLEKSDLLGSSPGEFYEAVTEAMGFIPLRHEGKVLGLAAHGNARKLYGEFRKALRPNAAKNGFDSDFTGRADAYAAREAYLEALVRAHPREEVAAAAQAVFEDAIVEVTRELLARTGKRTLAVNGGVFANVKLNQRLAALPELDRLFVFPAMSDTGNSVGAALFFLQENERAAPPTTLRSVYWGSGWDEAACAKALAAAGIRAKKLDEETLIARAADAIHAGRVVGWFQGRMEFGPRALGNRSMLARPTDAEINKTLNARLARTEFMPFAPSVLEEHAAEIFDNAAKSSDCLPFMTITCDVKQAWRSRIPAVVHVDGTARPQTVSRESNPLYWKLIDAYRQRSGIPLVLNTSFNVHEEPIVCFPENAVQALADDRIDCLALGPFWAERPRIQAS
ncbi:MAG TPA: carbamoyltransferase C-terminal domain-containing protein [Burkholderiales bacterium]|nr:carbamoyltransferase C-terminal domain-containing protein [Burkholderiales bacterium]